ncbi:MAG TPA: NAD(P)/FAD-dependent oxidoreductase [Terriglobales bacterium]|nr:NAD(P)/FAD-dependent oxidoreductase [Terriglobales bacterium]
MKTFDVVIVGAGPAGSAAAIALACRGYEVALIDKQNFPREKLCGDFVNPVNWPIFRELGVEERILAEPHSCITRFRMTACSGAFAEAVLQASESRSFGLGLARARLDHVLLQRAQEAGATIRTGVKLGRIGKTPQSWQLTTSAGESWQAKFLIGADGRNSWVAQQLGMNGHSTAHSRSVGFQLRLKFSMAAVSSDGSGGVPWRVSGERGKDSSHPPGTTTQCRTANATRFDSSRIEIHLFPGGYAGLVEVGDGTVNLGLAIDRAVLPQSGIKEFLLTERLVRNPALKAVLRRCESSAEPRSAYPVYFPRRRSFCDGALLVGDAARVTEPVTGEGIYFAMRSGLLAAETLDRALRHGDGSAHALRRYEKSCVRALRPRMRLNALLRFAIYRPALVDPLIQWSSRHNRALRALVNAVCVPATV